MTDAFSSRMLFDKWQAKLVKCFDDLVCARSVSRAAYSELAALTQIRGLPIRIAGLRRPILAPRGYVVRVVVLRFDLGLRRCECHGLATDDINKMHLERPSE